MSFTIYSINYYCDSCQMVISNSILPFLLYLLVGPFFTIKKGFRLCSIDLIESFTAVSMASWILILVSDQTPLLSRVVVMLQSLGQPSQAGSRYLSVMCPSFLDYFLTSETSCFRLIFAFLPPVLSFSMGLRLLFMENGI